jgi:hypothetical protein
MTSFAFLNAPLHCPTCGGQVTDQAWFQWGFCRSRAPEPESSYVLGEAIRWKGCPGGEVPAWTSFRRGDADSGTNMGTPEVRNVIVRDWAQSWLQQACPLCGAALGGAAVEIRDGTLVRAWLTRAGELGAATYHRITNVGCRPVPEWENCRLAVRDDC